VKPFRIAHAALAKFNDLPCNQIAERVSPVLQPKFLDQSFIGNDHRLAVLRLESLALQQSVDRHVTPYRRIGVYSSTKKYPAASDARHE
jgi:hypothetical protein